MNFMLFPIDRARACVFAVKTERCANERLLCCWLNNNPILPAVFDGVYSMGMYRGFSVTGEKLEWELGGGPIDV